MTSTNTRCGLLSVASALALLLVAPAQAQVGGAAVVFLQIEPDSRAAGMGNANVAVADNASAMFWNPAGLAFQDGIEASLTHSQWLPALQADLFYDFLTARYRVEGLGTVGAHITYLNLGEQEYRDEQNNLIGTFSAYDLAIGASFSTKVTENLGVGAGLRFIYSNLTGGDIQVGGQDTQAGVAVGVDLSALYKMKEFNVGGIPLQPSFGVNLANMGPTIQYSDSEQSDPIPTNIRFGTALTSRLDDFNKLTFAVDFNKTLIDFEYETQIVGDSTETVRSPKPFYEAIFSSWKPISVNLNPSDDEQAQDEDGNYQCALDASCERVSVFRQLTVGLGLEYWYSDLFALRTGYFYEDPYNGNRKYLTFGAGIRYNLVGVDLSYIYAVEEQSPLSDTIRFSLLLNINR